MKILAIRGRNIASLEGDFEVDFRQEPLRSAGIFAISGKTGAGKTTILDTMSLALFSQTARLKLAETGKIADSINKKSQNIDTISLNDSRSMLRRSAGEGYAEVEFIAPTGETYVSTWMTRRAGDKPGGKLQGITMSLLNMTTNTKIEGSKAEITAKVEEVLGLNFDQFTRSVLLAQGDFAKFLKAKQNEKAELLEKITGTEIYSEISKRIFDKNAEAKNDFNQMEALMANITIVPDEEIALMEKEEADLKSDCEKLESNISIINKKIDWINTHNRLYKDVESASIELNSSKENLENNKPRFQALSLLESVQEVRDEFKKLQSTGEELTEENKNLIASKQSLSVLLEKRSTLEHTLKLQQEQQVKIKSEWEAIYPIVNKARELDLKIVNESSRLKEADREFTDSAKSLDYKKKSLYDFEKEYIEATTQLKAINEWFESKSKFSSLVDNSNVILKNISDAKNLENEITKNKNKTEELAKNLARYEAELVVAQTKKEKLEQTLTTEIAKLREQLKDNMPCPVCGSKEHPVSNIVVDKLEEEELNRLKIIVDKNIVQISENISACKSGIGALELLVSTQNETLKNIFGSLETQLSIIDNWHSFYANNMLATRIEALNNEWGANIKSQQALVASEVRLKDNINSLKVNIEELSADVAKRSSSTEAIKLALNAINQERAKMLDGKKADDVEISYKKSIDETSALVEKTSCTYNNSVAESRKIEGSISIIENSIKSKEALVAQLSRHIDTWLANREDGLKFDELLVLLDKTNSWINTERQALTLIIDTVKKAKSRLEERNRILQDHSTSEGRPEENETIEALSLSSTSDSAMLSEKRDKVSQLRAMLTNNADNKKKVGSLKDELEAKRVILENWTKLNKLLGSKEGTQFKNIAQGYTLDVLLAYANIHLNKITSRYVLDRVAIESLSLQVIDKDMLSEVRSVHTLSGGESFLISLALALGLASLSSKKMNVESLFIDEGFGTLDAETLSIAMDTLESLHQEGKKIGVISHVAEMAERITTQIRVNKISTDKSYIEII